MKLDIRALAISGGIFWGVYMFLVALVSSFGVNLPWFNAKIVETLSIVYFGYQATIGGAFIGFIYGLICGGVSGGIFAWLYNKFLSKE